ncbi:MAG: DUF177 domain-containing protein [Elusimicrobia bacterium]|nr:DUF177 domain-containing protein [Elusimicrobiota bacterium]
MDIANLLFDINNIKDNKGLKIKGTCAASLFNKVLDKSYEVNEVFLDINFSAGSDSILAQGFIKGKISLICARCNEAFEYKPKESFTELYDYSQKSADIESLIASLLSISIPMKPLCSDDCKGICAICGTNLNTMNCECSYQNENAFVILKDLAI